MVLHATAIGIAAAVGYLSYLLTGNTYFVPEACTNIRDYVAPQIVGQEQAMKLLKASICEHLAKKATNRPLVLSSHGPPGVGKTYTHQLLARAMYNKHPEKDFIQCPGKHCQGYLVIFGVDYLHEERNDQLGKLKATIIEHMRMYSEPIIVIEEYDKVDCDTREMLRQLFTHPEVATLKQTKAIFLLESNVGMNELTDMIPKYKGRDKIPREAIETKLKELMFHVWRDQDCTGLDILRVQAQIDQYLPYLPLGPEEIRELFKWGLDKRAYDLRREKNLVLVWDKEVVDYLLDKVEMDGEYALEGAVAVEKQIIGYVSDLLQEAPHQEELLELRLSYNMSRDVLQVLVVPLKGETTPTVQSLS